jgi:hypothetical protein
VKTTAAIAVSTILALSGAGCGASRQQDAVENAAPVAPQPSSFRHEAAGVQFDIPGGWRSRNDGDRMSIAAPDGSMTIIVLTAAHENMGAVADEVDRQLGQIVGDVKVDGDLARSTINGIPVFTQRGTGTANGRSVDWAVRLYEARQHVLVLSFGEPGAFDHYYADVTRFVESVRPL